MRQLDKLFKKLNNVSEQHRTEKSRHPDRIDRKLRHASATLSDTSRKLDHLAGNFTSGGSDDAGYQAA
jgi:hypothetical protein